MTFTTTELANEEYLVEGRDSRGNGGQMIVHGAQWNRINRNDEISRLHEEFDDKVAEFFAPLTAAVDELNEASRVTVDPLLYIVEQEGREGTPAQRRVLTELEPGTVILRAIATGNSDRLIWVINSQGQTELKLLAQAAPVVDRYDTGLPEDTEPELF